MATFNSPFDDKVGIMTTLLFHCYFAWNRQNIFLILKKCNLNHPCNALLKFNVFDFNYTNYNEHPRPIYYKMKWKYLLMYLLRTLKDTEIWKCNWCALSFYVICHLWQLLDSEKLLSISLSMLTLFCCKIKKTHIFKLLQPWILMKDMSACKNIFPMMKKKNQ